MATDAIRQGVERSNWHKDNLVLTSIGSGANVREGNSDKEATQTEKNPRVISGLKDPEWCRGAVIHDF